MSDDDEWAMFGSDSDGDEDESTEDVHEKKEYSDKELQTAPTSSMSKGFSLSSASSLLLDKAIDELCLFITKQFITTSRSIPLNLRYCGTPSDQIATCTNYLLYKKKVWNDSFSNKMNQRGIKLVQSSTLDQSTNSCNQRYLSDAGNMFRVFHKTHNDGSSNFFESIEQQDSSSIEEKAEEKKVQLYESNLRRTIVPGGFLLLTMYIHSKVNDIDGESKIMEEDVSHLISQWNLGKSERIFCDSVWDIENAFIVSHITGGNTSTISKSATEGIEEIYTIFLMKRPCTVNTLSCPWKTNTKHVPSSFYTQSEKDQKQQPQKTETWLQYERRILADATVSLSIAELENQQNSKTPLLTKENIQKATRAIQTHGFVILPSLLSSPQNMKSLHSWSDAIMSDFLSACKILQSSKDHSVDIFNPGKDDTFDPISYKEMAMREDLRVDLRDGPCISQLRNDGQNLDLESLKEMQYRCLDGNDNDIGTRPTIIDSSSTPSDSSKKWNHATYTNGDEYDKDDNEEQYHQEIKSLRFNPNILEIVRKLLNPNDTTTTTTTTSQMTDDTSIPMYKGNFGRYNFDGSGPNGSPQSLRVGQIGSVISLPQAGDQAIHADTPHIFELYDCLPCHYANVFILGDDGTDDGGINRKVDLDGNYTGDNPVGGTAFVHGSHRLTVTAKLTAEEDAAGREKARDEKHMRIIRPSLVLGDALIFDTRVLHFGLANQSKTKCRPMLYVNMTHSWFNDPKNWDDKKTIF